MKIKKCCFMDRECTQACVAYSVFNELSEGAKNLGLNDMHCMRLLMELADIMNTAEPLYPEDSEDDDVI